MSDAKTAAAQKIYHAENRLLQTREQRSRVRAVLENKPLQAEMAYSLERMLETFDHLIRLNSKRLDRAREEYEAIR